MLKEIFAWWTGNTLGTRLTLWLSGAEHVGTDELGNKFYRAPEHYKGQGERRFVTYASLSEASLVPPVWHGWLHHQTDELPTAQNSAAYDWQLPHMPNMTGTPQAYRPPGSLSSKGHRPPATGDYEAWRP